MAIAE
jgi:hypothetical protein